MKKALILQQLCGLYTEANSGALLRREIRVTGVESEAQLVSDLDRRPLDSYGD
jgi:hypothetical protein